VIETGSFGALLRQYRLAARLSQEALAERARLSVTAIAALERGRRTAPRPGSVLLLAEALDLSADQKAALVEAAGRARDAAPSQRPDPTPPKPRAQHNLPADLSTFIGRAGQVQQVGQLLETARLVTLTGAGGMGKSRLALRVARDALERFDDGVWLLDLLPLHDSSVLATDVAHSLGVEEAGRLPLDSLLDALRTRQMLLVLDNAEHLLDAVAPLVADLLAACPGLSVLATSRVPLHVRAEQVMRELGHKGQRSECRVRTGQQP